MADLLGAANRVPGYDSANNNRALPTEMRPSQTQIQNVPDPTRVGRPDAKDGPAGGQRRPAIGCTALRLQFTDLFTAAAGDARAA